MESQLTEAGYEVDLQFASNDVQQQLNQVTNMINTGCEVVVISAIEGSSLGSALDLAKEKGIPVWDGGKVPSGWLIEHAGLKGKEFYGMRVSDKAALILINENAKNYADLAKARQVVIDTVKEKFGYTLEQEPMELGDE